METLRRQAAELQEQLEESEATGYELEEENEALRKELEAGDPHADPPPQTPCPLLPRAKLVPKACDEAPRSQGQTRGRTLALLWACVLTTSYEVAGPPCSTRAPVSEDRRSVGA
eukprot:1186013-Prorocentrum_minimum.AAC.6